MKLNFDYKGTKITYDLTFKKANAISIKIDADGKVNVVAPRGTSVYAVMDKVKGNAPWIISELHKGKAVVPEKKLLKQYTYLGKNYSLEIMKSETEEAKMKLVRGKFVVETNDESTSVVRNAILEWYKEKLTLKLKERIKIYKNQFEKIPTQIIVEYNEDILFRVTEDTIFANIRLGVASADVIDFVLVSSLCGINGISTETGKLEEILPNYMKSKTWLEENKNSLSL